jgi:acyl-coenzyme A thioesterase PaaI-like protein
VTPAPSPYRQTLGVITPDQPDAEPYVLPFRTNLLGRPGFLHGGAIAGFLAVICDATAEADGGGHNPATTSMNFLRGGRERNCYAQAVVRARTSRLLVIEAAAWQESPDRPIAMMSRTYLR